MDRYDIISKLGEGSFGRVYQAKDKVTDQLVATKKLKQPCNPADFATEVLALTLLEHPNIVSLKGTLHEGFDDFLIFEYMEGSLGGLIADRRRRRVPFSEAEIRSFSFQVLTGLEFLHRQGFMHRDLKPQNLLVNNGVIKISDLGSAIELNSGKLLNQYGTTRWYRAPEMLLGSSEYDEKVDMWSMGLIMAELFRMEPLFMGQNSSHQLDIIFDVIGSDGVGVEGLLPYASEEAINLLQYLCAWDPSERLSAEEALEHPFFKGQNVEVLPAGFSCCTRRMNNVVPRPSAILPAIAQC